MKPSIPKGTRDFTPDMVRKRTYIFNTIRTVFEQYGYEPIETPTMENLSTLTGKYGDEGDQLLFKVLNNGDYLSKADEAALEARDSAKLTSSISKRGLRYDLTVPFARFVVMNQNDIPLPFKRYQIQPVWRADRPQKGRYQEFYQCDVDVVGSNSLMYEAELMQIYDRVFQQLQLQVSIRFNNRKILAGMAEAAGIQDRFMDMTVAIDKLDKIGMDGVKKELSERGIAGESLEKIQALLQADTLEALEPLLESSPTGQAGLKEIRQMLDYLGSYSAQNTFQFDPTLARGLSYYTGCIFEVVTSEAAMGSLGGGGRYDDLTGVFGLKDVSGVGVSFGAERIYDVLEELGRFPEETAAQLQVLFVTFDQETHFKAFDWVTRLRAAGVFAELYPDPGKMKKQMKYANARKVPFVAIVGQEELERGEIALKNMETGEQVNRRFEELLEQFGR